VERRQQAERCAWLIAKVAATGEERERGEKNEMR
jgi:hypothetical protein